MTVSPPRIDPGDPGQSTTQMARGEARCSPLDSSPARSAERAGPGSLAYLALGVFGLLSAWEPVDSLTWILEVLVLATVYVGLAFWCRVRPRPTAGFLWVLWVYGFVMLIGAHWTYGHAPPGEWLRESFGLYRNPWDRVGHIFQGAVPALFMIGLLSKRTRPWKRFTLALLAGLSTALVFEGLEAMVAFLIEDGAGFVQAQGDALDSAFDVLFAALGASLAALISIRTSAAYGRGLNAAARLPSTRQAGS